MTLKAIVRAAVSLTLLVPPAMYAQQEGPVPTEVLVTPASHHTVPQPADLVAEVDGKKTAVRSVTPLDPARVQIALMIDDGLRGSIGRQISDIKDWINGLPAGTGVLVGYMQNGRVVSKGGFLTDHAAAAAQVRLPFGAAGVSGSPYFSLSDFVKHWPGEGEPQAPGAMGGRQAAGEPVARFVLMVTNGVDLYNGSVSPLNQYSPYVQKAISDAQRSGAPVYSIYYTDAGIGGRAASFSGQSYLSELAERTGGTAYFQGTFNPVSFAPFFKRFDQAIARTSVVTVDAVAHKSDTLVRFQVRSRSGKVKLRAPQQIHPGARE